MTCQFCLLKIGIELCFSTMERGITFNTHLWLVPKTIYMYTIPNENHNATPVTYMNILLWLISGTYNLL